MNKSVFASVLFAAAFVTMPLSGKENRASEFSVKHGTRVAVGKSKTENKVYKAKGGSRVVIVNKSKEEAAPESVVAFYSPENQKMCSLSFLSEDGDHGYGVAKAGWTPDDKYFVFSMTSSGGHQSWHAPTLFYSVRHTEIESLDSYTAAAGISKGEFALKPPNIVLTEVWKGASVPTRFRLDSLVSGGRKSRQSLRCADGRVFRVDPYDLKNHD